MAQNSVSHYHFKDITVVPSAKDFLEIVLSRTQRKTPTEIHRNFKISRIRNFYMRKIKFCQQTIRDKLQNIISQFPRLDDIHPFYSDLCNVLYDKDHYKIALGQVNGVKSIIDGISKEFIRLIKFADSMYKCKMLKRAALGKMCTTVKKLQSSFTYLEEVRQHLSRLPTINPHTRTLILCGYPNVGKSSFMNRLSNANVEVQPYAFTTKSLFVGHFDYSYSRWQVIDTPGILDRPLEERNTIEMTAITALAHIQCAVLYFLDLSETCGFSLNSQIELFNSIFPLFNNKPIVIIINKIDLKNLQQLDISSQNQIKQMANGRNVEFMECSTLSTEGIDAAKDKACSLLMEKRILEKTSGNRSDSIMNRLFITNSNINKNRPPNIPPSVVHLQQMKNEGMTIEKEETEKDLQEEFGGPGVYSFDFTKKYMLANDEWRYDKVPEIYNGKNIFDFVDLEIENKLDLLQKEELLLEQHHSSNYDDTEWREKRNLLKVLHKKIDKQRVLNRNKKSKNKPSVQTRNTRLNDIGNHLKSIGCDTSIIRKRNHIGGLLESKMNKLMEESKETKMNIENESYGRKKMERTKKTLRMYGKEEIYKNEDIKDKKTKNKMYRILRSKQRTHNNNNDKIDLSIKNDINKIIHIQKLKLLSQKHRNINGAKGEADRFIGTKKPKHLYSGKRGIGKTDRR